MDGEQTTRLTLHVGERHTIALRALATAGYRWSGSVGGAEPAAVALEVRRGEASPDAPPGASAPEEAVLQGMASGRASVRLELGRPWERVPAEVIDLDVEVVPTS